MSPSPGTDSQHESAKHSSGSEKHVSEDNSSDDGEASSSAPSNTPKSHSGNSDAAPSNTSKSHSGKSDEAHATENEESDDNVVGNQIREKYISRMTRKRGTNDLPTATPDFNNSPLEQYDLRLVGRSCCAMSRVNLEQLEKDYNFGLTEILKPLRRMLELSLPYCESVVKVFYTNLNMDKNGLVSTTVRGQKIVINEKKLLRWLDIKQADVEDRIYDEHVMVQTLLETRNVRGIVLVRPKQLPDKYRVLHYLYSRNFANKGGHYTVLTPEDKQHLTSIIRGKPFNVGTKILDTMLKASTIGKRNTQLPYPSLVSLILEKHKVWYLEEGEIPIWTDAFDDKALHRMHIQIGNKETSAQHNEAPPEAEHSTGPQADPQPQSHQSPLGETHQDMKEVLGKLLDEQLGELATQINARINNLEHVISKVSSLVTERHDVLGQKIAHMEERIRRTELDVKDLTDFIHLYSTELAAFSRSASFKQARADHEGPSNDYEGQFHQPHSEQQPSDFANPSPTEVATEPTHPHQPDPSSPLSPHHSPVHCHQLSPTQQHSPPDHNMHQSPPATEPFDPITPLSIVTLPEPQLPPGAPSRQAMDIQPLSFIPNQSFMSHIASENVPNVFPHHHASVGQHHPSLDSIFVPVNLPPSQAPPRRRAPPKRSPAKRRKKNN